MEHTSPRTSPAPAAHLQQGPTRPLLAGDALLQARIKTALDNVKLALHDFKEELQDTSKLGGEVAGLRGDLAGLRAAWEQQALDSSEKLHQKLEAALTTTLSSTLAQLGSTASSLTASFTSVATSINDSETRFANLLSTRFASLQNTQSTTAEAVHTLETRLLAELQKVKSDVLRELKPGSVEESAATKKLNELSEGMGEVLARQQKILDGIELGKGSSEEVEALRDRLDRVEKEKEEDRKSFTAELASLSATLSPLASSIPQLTTLLRATNPTASRAPSFDSYGAPPPAQPNQERSASFLGAQSLGEGSLGPNHSLGSATVAAAAGVGSRSSSSQDRRPNGAGSKTLTSPQPSPRVHSSSLPPNAGTDTLASTAPANLGSETSSRRSSTTPPEPLDRTSNPHLSPPHGPSTQALFEPSPSPAAPSGPPITAVGSRLFATVAGTSIGGAGDGAAMMSSSAPAMMLGGGGVGKRAPTGSGGSGRRNKRRILQDEEEQAEEEKTVEGKFGRYVVEETPEEEQQQLSSKRRKRGLPQDPSSDIFPPGEEEGQQLGGGEGDLSGEDADTT